MRTPEALPTLPALQAFVIEYSESQQAFHVDTLDRSIAINLERFRSGATGDWVPVGIVEDRAEANQFINRLTEWRVKGAA